MTETQSGGDAIKIEAPDHSEELLKASDAIQKLKKTIKTIEIETSINDGIHTKLYDDIVYVLMYVGDLSESVFDLQDQLETQYLRTYIHTPELAKTLWLEHLDKLHYNYNLQKNRCYKLLEELDALYHKKFKKHPPNWKI